MKRTNWPYLLALCIMLSACGESQLEAPQPPAFVHEVPPDWHAAQQARTRAIDAHIKQHRAAYDRFANFPASESDGIPFIILKLFPVVAPEYWGSKEDFLDVVGLFNDERLKGYPAPLGIGFSGLSRKGTPGNLDYASFTCGACHIGRVRLDDGRMQYLDGGINGEFNVMGFHRRVGQTLDKIGGGEPDADKREQRVIAAFLAALDTVHQRDPNYFYRNYSHEDRKFDTAYEQSQIDLLRQQAAPAIVKFMRSEEQVNRGWRIIAQRLYPEIEPEVVQGYAGMEDAIAFGMIDAYFSLRQHLITRPLAGLALPSHPGLADIMAVWQQDARSPSWNEDKSSLVDGGGQWNGQIPLPIYKKVAAELALLLDNVDVRVAASADQLLDKLPAPAYPFAVDVALANKGKALFAENCAACHQPHNGKVYRITGTDANRGQAASTLITLGTRMRFAEVCPPALTLDMQGVSEQPCAAYKGVSLDGKKEWIMTPPSLNDGYNALPLIGVWAQGPYLHNGSVPTLYHMLMPRERPAIFVKGRLDFDREKVGFAWDPNVQSSPARKEGYLYYTTLAPVVSNTGHDKNIQDGDKTFILDWSNDKAGAMAIIEYLKTL